MVRLPDGGRFPKTFLKKTEVLTMKHHQIALRKKIRDLQRNRGFQQSEMLSIMRLANTEIIMILPLITFLMMKPALSMKEEFLL